VFCVYAAGATKNQWRSAIRNSPTSKHAFGIKSSNCRLGGSLITEFDGWPCVAVNLMEPTETHTHGLGVCILILTLLLAVSSFHLTIYIYIYLFMYIYIYICNFVRSSLQSFFDLWIYYYYCQTITRCLKIYKISDVYLSTSLSYRRVRFFKSISSEFRE